MNLRLDDGYEELAIEWQYQMICPLKAKLEKFGVAAAVAKEIVGDFAFDMAVLHDQGEIAVGGNRFNPRIAFDDFSGNLICSAEETDLHDYAFGSTSEAYGE